jgi:hypothetical protein
MTRFHRSLNQHKLLTNYIIIYQELLKDIYSLFSQFEQVINELINDRMLTLNSSYSNFDVFLLFSILEQDKDKSDEQWLWKS